MKMMWMWFKGEVRYYLADRWLTKGFTHKLLNRNTDGE